MKQVKQILVILGLLGPWLALAPGLAWASPEADSALAEARRQYRDLEYERVIALLTPYAASSDLPLSTRLDALELLGLSHLILGKEASARAAFTTLLRLDPAHVLRDPSGSPKLLEFFAAVRRSLGLLASSPEPLELRLLPPVQAEPGGTVAVEVEARGPVPAGVSLLLRYRYQGELTWQSMTMARGGAGFRARLDRPGGTRRDERLEVFAELRGRDGKRLQSVRSAADPMRTFVAAGQPKDRPVWARWWFWTAIGAVVVGGVTAGVVLLTSESAPQGSLQPGVVNLR